MPTTKPIEITVFTGYLGSGKTSIILSLLPQLPQDYKVVLLKNEFGDVEVDSQLAKQSSLTAVAEILNGCMCCVLVGQMKTAILDIREKYRPDRIIIESSGSAFPATLAFQLRDLERETSGDLKLDAIVTVIDAENFTGYEDHSPTAKMQASYSDVILINKWERVDERTLDIVVDHINTLNDQTPRIRCQGRQGVDPSLVFGLNSTLFQDKAGAYSDPTHSDEVETLTVFRGPESSAPRTHDHGHRPHHSVQHLPSRAANGHSDGLPTGSGPRTALMNGEGLSALLATLSKESVWRVKGFVRLSDLGMQIVNWAFGRYELTPWVGEEMVEDVKLTVMGERGEVRRAIRRFAEAMGTAIL